MNDAVPMRWCLLGYQATLEWDHESGRYWAFVAEIDHLQAFGRDRATALRRLVRLLEANTH